MDTNMMPHSKLDDGEDGRPSKKHKGESSGQTQSPSVTASSAHPRVSPHVYPAYPGSLLSHFGASSTDHLQPNFTSSTVSGASHLPSHAFQASHHLKSAVYAPTRIPLTAAAGPALTPPPGFLAAQQTYEEAAASAKSQLETSQFGKQPLDKDEQYARNLQNHLDAESHHVDKDARFALKLSRTFPEETPPEGAFDGDFDWNAHLYKSKLEYGSLPAHLKHDNHYCDDPDYLYALKLQNGFDMSAIDADEEDTFMGGTSPTEKAEAPLQGKHSSDAAEDLEAKDDAAGAARIQDGANEGIAANKSTNAENATPSKAPTIPEVNLLDLQLPGADDRLRDVFCAGCGEKCFNTEEDVIKLVNGWHGEKLRLIGYTLTCHACRTPICPGCFGAGGCSPETPGGKYTHKYTGDNDKKLKHRLRSSNRHGSGRLIPSWACHKAPLQIVWLVLIHFDHQLAKQQFNRTSTTDKRARRRGTGPRGVGYGADFYDDWDYELEYGDDSADDDDDDAELTGLSPSSSASLPVNPISGTTPSKHYLDKLHKIDPTAKFKLGSKPFLPNLKQYSQSLKAEIGKGSSASDNGHSDSQNKDPASVDHSKLPSIQALNLPNTKMPQAISQSWAKFDDTFLGSPLDASLHSHIPGSMLSAYQGQKVAHASSAKTNKVATNLSWSLDKYANSKGHPSMQDSSTKTSNVTANPSWSLDKHVNSKSYSSAKPETASPLSTIHHSWKENSKATSAVASSTFKPTMPNEGHKGESLAEAPIDPADIINARNMHWRDSRLPNYVVPASHPPALKKHLQKYSPEPYLSQNHLPPPPHPTFTKPASANNPPYSVHAPHYSQPTQSSLAKATSPSKSPNTSSTHQNTFHVDLDRVLESAISMVDNKGSVSPANSKPPATHAHAYTPESLPPNPLFMLPPGAPPVPPGPEMYDDWDDGPQFEPFSYYSRYRQMRTRKDKNREAFEEARKKQDDLSKQCFRTLCALFTSEGLKLASSAAESHAPEQLDQTVAQSIFNLLMPSSCIDHIAELVRGTLQDVQDRRELYDSMLHLLQILSKPPTAEILVKPRPYKRTSLLLHPSPQEAAKYTGAEEVPSVRSCMSDLIRQCKVYSHGRVDSGSRKKLKPVCQSYVALAALLDGLRVTEQTTQASPPNLQDRKVWWEAYHKEHAFEEVPDGVMLQNHFFGERATTSSQPPAKGRMKRLVEEGANLTTSLPPGIFVRYAENRPDIMKALIIGPAGTPYHGGMFEFDLWADPQYPKMPPKCHFMTTGGGRAHFNPNLYNSGKVCLSLLGTWAGEPWRPEQSTILQILVSLQAMVLTSEPWYNEPGRESDYARQQKQSKEYNKEIQRLTVKWAMEDVLKKEQEAKVEERKTPWCDVIQRYIANNTVELTKTVNDWARLNKGLFKDAEEFLQRMTAFV